MVGINKDRTLTLLPVQFEDSMETLIELLVSPLLPFKSNAQFVPSVAQQESLSKQMQAVVLLYNFYHRKQFPQTEFLSFESLCKSVVIANPAIISYFQFMKEKQSVEKISTVSSSDNLSLVEKAVIRACDISVSLYNAFGNNNNNNNNNDDDDGQMNVFERWPVERIGVFLVDKKREKCLIEIDAIVEGVWSLVEKEVKREKGNNDNNEDDTNCVLVESLDEILQNLAVSEVKSRTGIKSSNLSIVHCNLTYSLNKEKSSTRVYIMEYTKQPSQTALVEIPINFIIERLKGPIIKIEPRPEATSVASYHLLLPYVEIISNWLKNPDLSNFPKKQTFIGSLKEPMEIEKAQISGYNSIESPKSPMEIEKAQKDIGSRKEPMEIEKKQSNARNQEFNGVQKTPMKIESTQINSRNTKNDAKNEKSGRSQKERMELENTQKRETLKKSQKVPMEIEKTRNNVRNEVSNLSSKEKGIDVSMNIHNKRKHVGASYKIEKEISAIKSESKYGTSMSSSVKNEVVKSSGNEITESDQTPITDVYDKEAVESCIQVAVRRGNELCKNIRLLEDENAQCDMGIQALCAIDGGEVTPAVKSILAKLTNSNVGSQSQIKKKLKLRSYCQELDDVCRENKLILPKYSIFPSVPDERYTASAILKGPGFECTVSSDSRRTPKDAREQAALRLLDKLHSIVED